MSTQAEQPGGSGNASKGRGGGRAASMENCLASRVREVRGSYTQKAFAQVLGLSTNSYRRVEYGDRSLTEKEMEIIEKKFGVRKNWLLTGEGPQKTHKVSTELRASYDLEGDAACSEREMQHLVEDEHIGRVFGEDEWLKFYQNGVFEPTGAIQDHLDSMIKSAQKSTILLILAQASNPLDQVHNCRKSNDYEKDASKKFTMDIELIENLIEKTASSLNDALPANKDDIIQRKNIGSPYFWTYYSKVYDKIILDSIKSTFQEIGISFPPSDPCNAYAKNDSLLDFIEFIVRRYSLFELIVIQKAIHDFIVKNPLFSDHVKTEEYPYIDPKALIKSGVLPSSLGIAAQDDEGNGEEGDATEKG